MCFRWPALLWWTPSWPRAWACTTSPLALAQTQTPQVSSSFHPVLWIHITLMRIRIFFGCGSGSDFSPWCEFGSGSRSRLLNKASNPWKRAQIGSYSIHFGLSFANWCRSSSAYSLSLWCGSGSGSWFQFYGVPDFYLMRMWIRMRIQVTKMMWIHADTDPDLQHCFHWNHVTKIRKEGHAFCCRWTAYAD